MSPNIKFHELQKILISFTYLNFNGLWILNLSFTWGNLEVLKTPHTLQKGFEKVTVLPLYCHHIFETSKLGSTDSNDILLEVTTIKCNIFRREWL